MLGDRLGRMAISTQMMRGILNSIATRLDEARDLSRYLTGLLIFLGLLGTFWGLIETVGSVGKVVETLKPGGDPPRYSNRCGKALPRRSAAWASRSRPRCSVSPARSFSASSTCRSSQAQNRFYTDLEDWLSTTVQRHRARSRPPPPLRRGLRRHEGRDRAAARNCVRDRRQQGRDRRHGQPRRGDPGPRAPHAHRTADDPRLGRFAGRAEPGNP